MINQEDFEKTHTMKKEQKMLVKGGKIRKFESSVITDLA